MGTKTSTLTAALFPGTKRKILALFFLNADRQFYFSEVVRLTATRQGVVQRELVTLTEAGILKAEKRGRQKFYGVNKSNPVFPELRNIVFKTFGVLGQVREALKPLEKKIKVAFVYGSFARGEEAANSDLDLFVVGSASLADVVAALATVEKAIGREINPTLFALGEFKKKLSGNNHFVRSVVAADKEFVFGAEDELRGLAEE
jgi:predicted nucleotidyltransferase